VAGNGEVVIGAEQGNQTEDQAAEGLGDARAIQAGPGELQQCFWRKRQRVAAARGRRGGRRRWGHGKDQLSLGGGIAPEISATTCPIPHQPWPGGTRISPCPEPPTPSPTDQPLMVVPKGADSGWASSWLEIAGPRPFGVKPEARMP
jgi:hypothetical protein